MVFKAIAKSFALSAKDFRNAFLILLDPIVLEHLVVHPHVLALDRKGGLGRLGLDDEVVIAVRAVLVAFLELLGIFAEALLALLAGEDHLEALEEGVLLLLLMALDAVEPLAA